VAGIKVCFCLVWVFVDRVFVSRSVVAVGVGGVEVEVEVVEVEVVAVDVDDEVGGKVVAVKEEDEVGNAGSVRGGGTVGAGFSMVPVLESNVYLSATDPEASSLM
jgi:hypothetical protein